MTTQQARSTGSRRPLTKRDLAPGAYSITIQPGFRVLQDVAIAEVPVPSELVSDATQTFQISSGMATPVAYRFAVAGGTVAFDAG